MNENNVTFMTWQEAKDLQAHQDAKRLPRLLPEEFDALKQSIAQRGVSDPVLVNRRKDTILDGLHRRKACVELKAELPVIVYQCDEEKGEIVARALLGRTLTDDQRLALVIELELDELRAKAQQRIVEARSRMAFVKPQKPIHVHKEIAQKVGVGESKAHAAIEATERDRKVLKQVKEGKKRWRDVDKPKPAKQRKTTTKKAKPSKDPVKHQFDLCVKRCKSQKCGTEHQIKVRLAGVLFKVEEGDKVFMAESVTYPGKGTHKIEDALKDEFRLTTRNTEGGAKDLTIGKRHE
jgi:ParB-like chromosome segregation protein Spo0J